MKISFFNYPILFALIFFSKISFCHHGFAWSDQATFAGTKNLASQYNYNSSGSSIKVTYQSTGRYLVQFDDLGDNFSFHGGHVQVTAYGSNKSYCKVADWNRFRKINVTVACFNSLGESLDSQFTISVRNPESNDPSYAYTYADEPNETEYTTESKYTRTPGNQVVIKKISTGSYTATFKGLSAYLFEGAHVQVTTAGDNSHSCQIKSWYKVATDLQTNISCFTTNGSPVNTPFLIHVTAQTFHGEDSMWTAYAWGSSPTTASYIANSYYTKPAATINRSAVGVYKVNFTGVSTFGKSNVQVSTYGNDFTHCKVHYWSQAGSITSTVVNCFDQYGFFKDSLFVVRLVYK